MAELMENFMEFWEKTMKELGPPKRFLGATGSKEEAAAANSQWQKTVIQQMDIRFRRRYGIKIAK